MGLGYVVVLEKDITGIDPRTFDGRRLAAQRHTLDSIAHEEDLPGLGEFVAFSESEAETLAEDMKFDMPTAGTSRWFSCATALEVLRAIRTTIEEDPDEVREPEGILEDLGAMERILEAAEAASSRFRLSIDY